MLVGSYVFGATNDEVFTPATTRGLVTQNTSTKVQTQNDAPAPQGDGVVIPNPVVCKAGLPWWWLVIAGTGGVVVGAMGALAFQKKGRRR